MFRALLWLLSLHTLLVCYHTPPQHGRETRLKTTPWDQRSSGGTEGSELWLNETTEEGKTDTDLVYPQLAHNDVVHRGGDLSPHVVVPTGVELEVNGTWGREQGQKAMRKEEILQLFCCQTVAAVMTVISCFCDRKSVSAAAGEKKNKENHLQRHISFYFFLTLTKIDDIYLTVTPLHARLFITKQLS